ncbi:MAG: AraC family transcriptional regulator [Opitutaceae bacterium]|nr:AraC family transcriptional regulator [Opitutaceae bacterium]
MARSPSRQEQELLSPAVTAGAYFFIELGPRGDGPVRVAFGGRELCGEDYAVQRTTFPFPTLEYVAEGAGWLGFGRAAPHPLQAGTLFTYGPGVEFHMETSLGSSMVKYFVCLTGRGARAAIEERLPIAGRTATLANHGDLRDLFDLMIREGGEHTPYTRDICIHMLQVLLLKMSEACEHQGGRPSPSREKFLKCKTLIDEEAGRFASLQDIAAALHIEASGLNRLFRRYQGISPYQYLLRRKMNLAAQDLIANGGFIKEAAGRAGYPDPYHFSRVFKSVHGISPAHFLRHYAPD